MTEKEIKDKVYGIASKLEGIAGHYAVIESLHSEVYKEMEQLGIDTVYGGALSECENNFDYASLSCDIQNNDDQITEDVLGDNQE